MRLLEHSAAGATVETVGGAHLRFDFRGESDALEPLFAGTSWGAILWDPSLVLGQFLEDLPVGALEGKSVVELGACCGLPGLVAALCGAASTVLTDLDQYTDAMRSAVALNAPVLGSRAVSTYELFWGAEQAKDFLAQHGAADVVLASDCVSTDVYGRESWVALVETLRALTKDRAYICSIRRPNDGLDEFLALTDRVFPVHRVIPVEAAPELAPALTMTAGHRFEVHEFRWTECAKDATV